jgi:23S rRNA G2445 N2-methylase RlmL
MRKLTAAASARADYVVYVTKGLADVVEAELLETAPQARIRSRDERFVILEASAEEIERLGSTSRLADDIRLLVSGPRQVETGGELADACGEAEQQVRASVADAGDEWSVTLSARNPSWRERPTWQPGPVIAKHLHGATVEATARRETDLRIQVDGKDLHIAVNLWPQPVGKMEPYSRPGRPGALRRPVAAALVRVALAGVDPDVRARGVYDPFCGTGSVVVEAARAGLPVLASDIDPEAVEITRDRLALTIGYRPDWLPQRVFVHDVRSGLDARISAKVVVGNLPWGKQVKVDGRLALFDWTAQLVAQAVGEHGRAALLTTHEEQFLPRLRRNGLRAASRRIGLLGQTPAIVVAGTTLPSGADVISPS